eukprot:5878998-Amphidinium_carterae.1
MKPPLTWEEQDIRQFLGRVFGPDVVARVAALPAFWFNNNSWKDIQDLDSMYASGRSTYSSMQCMPVVPPLELQ